MTSTLPGAPIEPDLHHPRQLPAPARPTPRWVKVLDQTRCIGCHACTTACKSENQVPLGVSRTYVKAVDVGRFPQVRRAFQVTRCNQCDNPPCVAACPTGAMFQRPDGIVDFDKSVCIGCKACMAACPYDAIFINPDDHSAEKCNFCAHRIESGLEPACVVVCPTEAILVGDLNDPTSKVAQIIGRSPVSVRRAEKSTQPKLYYRGAHHSTLDPLAATKPEGDTYAWAEVPDGSGVVTSGSRRHHPNQSSKAVLAYDVAHAAPWGWRVSLYTWTKGIAAGAYLVALMLALGTSLPWSSSLLRFAAPATSLAFAGLTGILLIFDLKHPMRFWMLFTRPQKRSWLVRGGFVLGGYGAVLVAHLLASIAGSSLAEKVIAGPGLPFAVAAAVYTAFLFAQAKARDLWQSPVLPFHLAVQAILVGAAALTLESAAAGLGHVYRLEQIVAGAAVVHLLLVASEVWLPHGTHHSHAAIAEMVRYRYAGFFWVGTALCVVAVFAPAIGWPAAIAALVGLLAYEHAFVQAGQAIPLA
jgi:Fe-S-cluster-containing dehydrogenase component/formate-dependent nitrite reductase membrane component NrfD